MGPLPYLIVLLSALAAGGARAEPAMEFFTNPEPVMMHAMKSASGTSLYFTLAPGPVIQTADLSQLSPARARTVFEVPGYVVVDPIMVPAPAGAIEKAYAYFTMIEKAVAENCRKMGWDISTCPGALEKRTVGFARFDGNGWTVKGPVLFAKGSGDGTSPYAASAFTRGSEVWLYFSTAKRDATMPGIFRQKFAFDGETPVGEPERLQFEQAPGAPTFDRLDISLLKCEGAGAPFVVSMLASVRSQTALPFLLSGDGLHFRQEVDSVVPHNESPFTAALQLPVSATAGDCENFSARHQTRREIIFSERGVSGAWAVKHTTVMISVSGKELPGAEPVADPVVAAAAAEGKCTPVEYLRAHPGIKQNPSYAQNPMLHYLVFGKDEGACEPSLEPPH